MTDLAGILRAAHQLRPGMLALDMLKLIYQNEFGCGHLITDLAQSLARLSAEWQVAQGSPRDSLIEPIGNGYARLNLAPARQAGIALDAVHQAFVLSARQLSGSAAGYMEKAALLRRLCQRHQLPYLPEEIDDLLKKWEQSGQAPFSHSPAYRQQYWPAYRVMHAEGLQLLGL